MNRGWLWVIIGGVFETAWAVCMKLSDGFTNIVYDLLFVVFVAISLWFLLQGFRMKLPTGPCYAVWTGIGAVGSTFVGLFMFGETLPLAGWACMAMIIGGVVGLNLFTKDENAPE